MVIFVETQAYPKSTYEWIYLWELKNLDMITLITILMELLIHDYSTIAIGCSFMCWPKKLCIEECL